MFKENMQKSRAIDKIISTPCAFLATLLAGKRQDNNHLFVGLSGH